MDRVDPAEMRRRLETALPPIALAQTVVTDGDVEANIAQHISLAETAAAAGAAIVVFPELSLTGYRIREAPRLAVRLIDPRLEVLRTTAGRLGTILIIGAPLRGQNQIYLTSLIFFPSGLVDVYAKRRLGRFGVEASPHGTVPPPEETVFAPGRTDVMIPWGRTEAALAICADIGDPAHAARCAQQRASGYFASMFSIPSDYPGDAERMARYAREHRMVSAMANHGGPTGGLAAAGRTAFWDQAGRCVGELGAEGAGVLVARRVGETWEAERLAAPLTIPA